MQTTLGAAVRELRMQRGVSARSLARALNVSRSYVRSLESDELRPSRARLSQIATVLEANADSLFILSGRVPEDILSAFSKNPELFSIVRNAGCQNG